MGIEEGRTHPVRGASSRIHVWALSKPSSDGVFARTSAHRDVSGLYLGFSCVGLIRILFTSLLVFLNGFPP